MNREDHTEAPNEEIAGAPTLDSDEASRALARVQQVLDSDEDRARALEKAREKAEKAAGSGWASTSVRLSLLRA